MAYTFALQVPDTPLKEEWIWATDLHTSYNGEEDRIPLLRYPRRTFGGSYSFDRAADVRRHLAFMLTTMPVEFGLPLFQYQCKLKAPVFGGNLISINALRGDFRVGEKAFIAEGDMYEILTVSDVAADTLTVEETIANPYTARAIVCPMVGAYTATGATYTRNNPDGSAMAGFQFTEAAIRSPFISPLNDTTLTTYDGFTVLELRDTGTQFEGVVDNGMMITDYLNGADFFSPLTQGQFNFPVTFQCNRVLDNTSWLRWFKFADTIQGSVTPFLLPSYRDDMEIVTPANGSGNFMIVKGHEYSENYFPLDTYKRIAIDTRAGRRYAKVTAVVDSSGNDRITFTPALPSGSNWALDQKVSFLRKVRIADDKITCDHYGFHTDVTMTLRTVE